MMFDINVMKNFILIFKYVKKKIKLKVDVSMFIFLIYLQDNKNSKINTR